MWGQQEGQNAQIQKILDHFGSKLSQDAYPWCAPFVAYTFARAGVKGANTQSARAFLTKGQAVHRADARPGDVVVMGTPAGVGYARTPPVWMKAGDTIEIDIEGIGVLSNPVTA